MVNGQCSTMVNLHGFFIWPTTFAKHWRNMVSQELNAKTWRFTMLGVDLFHHGSPSRSDWPKAITSGVSTKNGTGADWCGLVRTCFWLMCLMSWKMQHDHCQFYGEPDDSIVNYHCWWLTVEIHDEPMVFKNGWRRMVRSRNWGQWPAAMGDMPNI